MKKGLLSLFVLMLFVSSGCSNKTEKASGAASVPASSIKEENNEDYYVGTWKLIELEDKDGTRMTIKDMEDKNGYYKYSYTTMSFFPNKTVFYNLMSEQIWDTDKWELNKEGEGIIIGGDKLNKVGEDTLEIAMNGQVWWLKKISSTPESDEVKDASEYVGTWTPKAIGNGKTVVSKEIYNKEVNNDDLDSIVMVLKADGSFKINAGKDLTEGKWNPAKGGIQCNNATLNGAGDYLCLISNEYKIFLTKSSDSETTLDEKEPAESNASSKDTSGLRPEFKEAMDSYEAFYDEYVEFMEKYQKNPTDLNLLSQYATMLTKVSEMDAKFKEWENSDMNNAETAYFLEVTARIEKKLLSVLQ